MAPSNNPLDAVKTTISTIHKALSRGMKTFGRLLKTLKQLLTNLVKAIVKGMTQLAATLGKAVVDGLVATANKVLDRLGKLIGDLDSLLQLVAKTAAFLKKLTDPAAAVARLKAALKTIRKAILSVIPVVSGIVADLASLEPLLKALDAMRSVLQLIFSWIGQVSVVLNLIKNARSQFRKLLKALKDYAKRVAEAMQTVGEIAAA